jgi:hypothetical protein
MSSSDERSPRRAGMIVPPPLRLATEEIIGAETKGELVL